jgi:hypothetical protein
MATKWFSPILGKRIRVTALDSCGNVAAAGTANSEVVTDGFISVKLSTEIESGAEIITKKADGTLCVNEKLSDYFKRFTLDLEFCGVNPSLIDLMTNVVGYSDGTDVIGFTSGQGVISQYFAFELWTGITGAACQTGASFEGGYLLLPFVVAGVIDDISIDGEKAISFGMKGAYTKGGNAWGVGPYNVVNVAASPSKLPTAVGTLDHFLLVDTTLAPPASSTDPLPMPPYITSITPVTGLAAGGTLITNLAGAGFTGATAVNFGATAATAFVVVSDIKITCTAPAHASGLVDVTVVKAGGNAVKVGAYTYT